MRRIPGHTLAAALLIVFAAPVYSGAAERIGQWRWSGVERVVVVPDIHGAYTELTELLKASGVVDNSLNWTGKKTHLVSLGDLLDRGADSRKVMDLLMRLQKEAPKHGGQVHVIAGNHEIMNLLGDLRYVSDQEFAAFADIETPLQREQAYDVFLERHIEDLALTFLRGGVTAAERDPKIRQDFENRYPPGYFGHREGLAPAGEYGRWLMSLPMMIVINRTLYVHGGLPKVTATASMDALNKAYKRDLHRFFELWRPLHDAGILTEVSYETNLEEARRALWIADPANCPDGEEEDCSRDRRRATDRQKSLYVQQTGALKEFLALGDSGLFGFTGPVWYRGSVRCKDIFEMPLVEGALARLGADRVVVGHTPTTDRRVHKIRDGKLIMLDTGMLRPQNDGRPAVLIIDRNHLEVLYLDPMERGSHLEDGGNAEYPLSHDQLREALRSGALQEVDKGWFSSSWQVKLKYEGVEIDAKFFPAGTNGSDRRELAAYRLDKLLGFGLVPITVARQVTGDAGVLQLAYPDFLTEFQRVRQRIDYYEWCPLTAQRELLEVYDLLIGNFSRTSSEMGYTMPYLDLQVSEHGASFRSEKRLPGVSKTLASDLPGSVRKSLVALNKANISAALGELLDDEAIDALLARRDALLEIIQHPADSYDRPAMAARDDSHR